MASPRAPGRLTGSRCQLDSLGATVVIEVGAGVDRVTRWLAVSRHTNQPAVARIQDGHYTVDKESERKCNEMRRTHPYSPQTIDAVRVLGLEVAHARRARRWTEAQLAERVGISAVTLRNIERGMPTVGIGTVFEAATILGIDLFGADRDGLRSMVERGRERLALLPARVREPTGPVRDDF